MITVRVIYTDGREDIQDVLDLDEVCLDGVYELKVIRDERSSRVA